MTALELLKPFIAGLAFLVAGFYMVFRNEKIIAYGIKSRKSWFFMKKPEINEDLQINKYEYWSNKVICVCFGSLFLISGLIMVTGVVIKTISGE